jgi:uncharacterized iron-regulated protein
MKNSNLWYIAIGSKLILGFIFLFSGCTAFAQLSEDEYKIYCAKSSKEVTLNEIATDIANFDVVFLGEEHNDSVIHFLENNLFQLLYQKYDAALALSLEMFDRDVQPVMNEYLNDLIREKNFVKDSRAWSNYKDYRPMVEFAKKNKLDVVCANAPSRYTNLAGRKGQDILQQLPKSTQKYFAPLPYDTASGKYYEKLMGITHDSSTGNDSTPKKAPPFRMDGFSMVMAQSLWDATMAYSISEYLKRHKGKKILQINGRFHSDEGLAVVTQLKKYAPKAKILIISASSDKSFPNVDWQKFKNLGDYIIITNPDIPKTYKENKG